MQCSGTKAEKDPMFFGNSSPWTNNQRDPPESGKINALRECRRSSLPPPEREISIKNRIRTREGCAFANRRKFRKNVKIRKLVQGNKKMGNEQKNYVSKTDYEFRVAERRPGI